MKYSAISRIIYVGIVYEKNRCSDRMNNECYCDMLRLQIESWKKLINNVNKSEELYNTYIDFVKICKEKQLLQYDEILKKDTFIKDILLNKKNRQLTVEENNIINLIEEILNTIIETIQKEKCNVHYYLDILHNLPMVMFLKEDMLDEGVTKLDYSFAMEEIEDYLKAKSKSYR